MNRFRNMFHGIYGFDGLSCGLLFVSILMNLLTSLIPITVVHYMNVLSYIPLFLCIYRVFSRNHYKRSAENRKFMKKMEPLFLSIENHSRSAEESKVFKFFKCSACGQKIRVPRGKGKIEITCPKCGNKFIKKT